MAFLYIPFPFIATYLNLVVIAFVVTFESVLFCWCVFVCLLIVQKAKLAERDAEVVNLKEQLRVQNEEVRLEKSHMI